MVHGADHKLLQLGSAEALGAARQFGNLEFLRVAASAGEVDGEDLFALFQLRQVDEEDFVEAALAQELRRQGAHIVGGGDEEDRLGLFLHPGEKGAEDAGGGAAVAHSPAAGAGEALLHLVHPQAARGERFGDADGLAHVLLALADETAKDAAHIELEHRELVGAGDRFGNERLAAALHADHQHAFRNRDAVVAGGVAEALAALFQPLLQQLVPAHISQGV